MSIILRIGCENLDDIECEAQVMIRYLARYLRLSSKLLNYPLEFFHLSEVETGPLLDRGTLLLTLNFQDPLFSLPHQLLEPISRLHFLLTFQRRSNLFDISEYVLANLFFDSLLGLLLLSLTLIAALNIFPMQITLIIWVHLFFPTPKGFELPQKRGITEIFYIRGQWT